MRAIVRPGWRQFVLLGFFLLLSIGGWIQGWTFSAERELGYPPPPFYEALEPFPIWPVWFLTWLPLGLLTAPFRALGVDVISGPRWMFGGALALYYYFLAGLIVWLWDRIRGDTAHNWPQQPTASGGG